MKGAVAIAALLAQGAYAFPPGAMEAYARYTAKRSLFKRQAEAQNATQALSMAQTNCGPLPCPVFVAEEQYVSQDGEHAYADPGPADIRGPCPGLNAAANHAYLPRNGIATLPETIDGLGQMFGMSPDLSGFLAAYAIVFDGDIITQRWSIGGPPPSSSLGDILIGKPQGISYSHNKYEGDTSIARFDAFLNNGDAYSLDPAIFRVAYESGMEEDRYTLDSFRQASGHNQHYSIQNNPYYFAPLFSTTLVAPAAYNFVINFMSNHSAEEPSGWLNGEDFKKWFAVEGEYPNFTWNAGKERMPENWYRRTSLNQYNAVNVFQDLLVGWAAYPDTFRFGGNTGTTNSYVGIDLDDFTNGVMNFDSLLEGNNFACFFFQNQQQAVPDALKGVVNDIAASMDFLNEHLGFLSSLSCPELGEYDAGFFDQYPGREYSPTAPDNN